LPFYFEAMDTSDIIYKYFPDLSADQKKQVDHLGRLYEDWNSKINVISRKDMDHFYERHVLHSLAIAKFIRLRAGEKILDVGTGGGFPGIPLAILFPETDFTLVDSIGKKIKIVESVAGELGLENVTPINGRAESVKLKVDFVVSRATAPLTDLVRWTMQSINKQEGNGLIALKGGDLDEELRAFKMAGRIPVSEYFNEPFFETKQIIFLPVK
jgi:16S rRNA (guanine527-N7)-methyltransferase